MQHPSNAAGLSLRAAQTDMLAEGDQAPDLALPRLDGPMWRLEEAVAGGPVLLVFIETDCPTCRLTVPYLQRLGTLLGAESGRLVVVSQDDAGETRALVERYDVTLPVLLDADLRVSGQFDPSAVPALFLLDRRGRIERADVGFDKGALNATAERLLTGVGLPPVTVAVLDDGVPASKPGCVSRHREGAAVELAPEPAPDPIDLVLDRGPRATRIPLSHYMDPYEYCMQAGFSPCLPVVPPTAERVDAMLTAVPHSPERVVGLVPPCYGAATVEKVAANAVMAGCRPEYMEVLLTVIRAACDERFNLHGIQATTHSATPLIIVSGPVSTQLGFASGAGLFGNVSRASSTVGRALQLAMANLGGAVPGEIDMSTLGNAGRFSYCVAESQASSPWAPLHVDLGFDSEESTVTLFAAGGATEVSEHTARTGTGLLGTIAATLSTVWSWRRCGRVDALVVLCPEHAATLGEDGFDKAHVRDFLFEHAGVPVRAFDGQDMEGIAERDQYEEIVIDGEPHYRKFSEPSQIRIIVAGGLAGKFSAVLGGWLAGPTGSESVTYPVRW